MEITAIIALAIVAAGKRLYEIIQAVVAFLLGDNK